MRAASTPLSLAARVYTKRPVFLASHTIPNHFVFGVVGNYFGGRLRSCTGPCAFSFLGVGTVLSSEMLHAPIHLHVVVVRKASAGIFH